MSYDCSDFVSDVCSMLEKYNVVPSAEFEGLWEAAELVEQVLAERRDLLIALQFRTEAQP